MATYDHATIDRKWQQYWEREHTFATPTDRTRPKYYVLDMFPYPSGDGLHVGHPRGYTATDVIARAKRMMGFNVLRVMGWDSFGLPAERRAERDGIHPSVITARNIAIFKGQLEKLGLSYDWARELATSDPRYYKWTQWIFELLFERGLAYRAEVPVNFCPALDTVLANEEVHDGKYIETGDPVEKRLLTQWMLRITAYADRLVEELDGLDWPAGTDKMQRDWIGKSIGANATFTVVGTGEAISVFTTVRTRCSAARTSCWRRSIRSSRASPHQRSVPRSMCAIPRSFYRRRHVMHFLYGGVGSVKVEPAPDGAEARASASPL